MTHHDIPEDDNGDHERLITCKCRPTVTYEHGHQIVTHHYIEQKTSGPIHILPLNDLKEHDELTTCECEPKLIFENGTMIVIHNSYDGREAVEWANEIINKK